MIRTERLIKRFGRTVVLDGVDFETATGEALALWGPNGAGKTTIIRCILGLLRYRGSITVDGLDVRREGKSARRRIGYVPQELAFYDDLRLGEITRLFARLKSVGGSPDAALDEVGLTEHRRKRVRELSGGMKQRLALALAMLADPPVLLLDELTANLDREGQSGFVELLQDLKRRGKTILFASHRPDEIEELADRVLVLEAGRVVRTGDPAEMLPDRSRTTLRVFVPEPSIGAAIEVLRSEGFDATRNGCSVHVEVERASKAAPVMALSRAHIDVRDFELEGGHHE